MAARLVTSARKIVLGADPVAFSDGDTTPDVSAARYFKTANTSATSVTTLDGGTNGDEKIIHFEDDNTTFVHGSTLKLPYGVNFEAKQYDMLICQLVGGVWRCK